MIAKGFPNSLWAEIVNAVVHILNHLAFEIKSPYEVFSNKIPRQDHLQVIGTGCFVYIPEQKHKSGIQKVKQNFIGIFR